MGAVKEMMMSDAEILIDKIATAMVNGEIDEDEALDRLDSDMDTLLILGVENKYDAIVAAGVISPNHAKPKSLKNCIEFIKPNGLIIFSLNDHAYNDLDFLGEIHSIIDDYNLKIIEKKYGDHLSKISLKSWIYVVKK